MVIVEVVLILLHHRRAVEGTVGRTLPPLKRCTLFLILQKVLKQPLFMLEAGTTTSGHLLSYSAFTIKATYVRFSHVKGVLHVHR